MTPVLSRARRRVRRGVLGDRWVARAATGAALWLAAYAAATALASGELQLVLLSDVAYMLPIAAASALCWVASRRAPGRQRIFWRLLAVGNASWLAGELAWSWAGGADTTPSVADALYLGWYAAALPAIVLASWPAVRSRGWRALLDASGVTAALAVAGWVWLIEPQLRDGASLAALTGIAYPLLDVAAMAVLVLVCNAGRGRVPLPVTLIAVGYGVTALADVGYTSATIAGTYDVGSWLDLGWQLDALLQAVAAVAVIRGVGVAGAAPRVDRDRGLPIVLAGTVLAAAVVAADLADGDVALPVAALAAVALGSLVARLVLASREHARAALHLDALLAGQESLSAALEARTRTMEVQARTLEHTLAENERAQEELARSVTMLRATLEATADAILVVDADGRIAGSNARFRELWQIADEVLETGDDRVALGFVLVQLRDPEAFLSKVEELYADPEAESFDVLEFADGRIVERTSKPHLLNGRVGGRVWSFRDVTERSRLEDELRQAHKLEAVGRIAGGVAHDFNNLLTAIGGYADLLLLRLEDPRARHAAEEILHAAERGAGLTSRLLAFSRKQVLQPTVVDLDEVATGLRGLLAPLLGPAIELAFATSGGRAKALVDRGQIEQVLLNLVINARDALPGGGRIAIATAVRGGEAILRVSDGGHGMDERTLAQAFEPFFTTKPAGAGTGLGLATVLGIVEQSGGRVDVESSPGAGTTVEVVLPAVAGAADGPPEDAAAPTGDCRGSVLLVEDEAIVRELLEQVLADAGFAVTVAPNGAEALEAAGDAAAVDVLLTDVVMPGMSGRELAERLVERRPGLQVVYMSGYTDDPVVRRVHESDASFLQKPFSPAEVVGLLRGLLAAA